MTQISMLSNDKNGKPTYGDKEAVVTKDLQYFTTGSREAGDQITTYYFVLKNNVKFSNGSPLTILIFNTLLSIANFISTGLFVKRHKTSLNASVDFEKP